LPSSTNEKTIVNLCGLAAIWVEVAAAKENKDNNQPVQSNFIKSNLYHLVEKTKTTITLCNVSSIQVEQQQKKRTVRTIQKIN